MQFNLPYSWLKEYVAVPKDARALASELSLHGVSIEKVAHVKHDFSDKVVVAEIVAIKKHPDADKLQIATVTTGKKQMHEIVCGAPNIAVGQKVPLALPGAVLPGDFVITERKVRGVASAGMLCAASELGLRDKDQTILVLHNSAVLGKPLLDHGIAEDYLLEVEPTTNRSDVAAVLGVAREVSAVTGKKMTVPKIKPATVTGTMPQRITISEKKRCRRFNAIYVGGVQVGESPWWMQERLARAGIRPINSVVDITNYVMLEYGHPLHAFDADKLTGSLDIRPSKKGERIMALDGKTYDLPVGTLVNADDTGPVDVVGIMGGEESGVTERTTNVLFEAATWDEVDVRQTSRKLQLYSDASRLFEKGLSTESPSVAINRAVQLCIELCGGAQQGKVFDFAAKAYKPTIIDFQLNDIERVMGVAVPAAVVKKQLTSLGFIIKKSTAKAMQVEVPHWREGDVALSVDLVEEVARLGGYHHIVGVLPQAQLVTKDAVLAREDALLGKLVRLGFSETMSYALVPHAWLRGLQFTDAQLLRVANPLSKDLEYLRPSLLPSLVKAVERNEAEQGDLRLFELAKVYRAGGDGKGLDKYRTESMRLAGVMRLARTDSVARYRQARGVVEQLVASLKDKEIVWKTAKAETLRHTGFSASQTAVLSMDGEALGYVGVVDAEFARTLGVNEELVAFDAAIEVLTRHAGQSGYESTPLYPAVKRDLAIVVNRGVQYTDLIQVLHQASSLLRTVELFDVYQGEQLGGDEQSLAMHLVFRSDERTLRAKEVDENMENIKQQLQKKYKANIR